MSEVLINDLNLNRIANSIRRKNGLVRTYKPREMAPAILAFRNFIPSTHEFTVTINQSPHQLITAKRYLHTQRTNHTKTFTVSEPYYIMELNIIPDSGYTAGTLNYKSPIVVDRDMVISATPPTQIAGDEWSTYYIDNRRNYYFGQWDSNNAIWEDEERTIKKGKASIYGKVILIDKSGHIPNFYRFLGSSDSDAVAQTARGMVELSTNINFSEASNFNQAFYNCYSLQDVHADNWNLSSATNCSQMFTSCGALKTLNAKNWNLQYVTNISDMFNGCSGLYSLDLSDWTTPRLRYASGMFSNCTGMVALDISGWDTTNIESFTLPPNVKYIIMDDDRDIKFKGNYAMPNPNNYVKYLVPSTMVDAYKAHANWSGRASRIVDIEDYTIIRYAGEVEVTENESD